MEFLTNLLDNSSFPLLTALILGLMTAISPCPLATNITAVGYIGKNLENKHRVFVNGIVYTLGRVFSYTILAVILIYSADQFAIKSFFQVYGEKFIGPLMIIIGLFILNVFKLNFPGFSRMTEKMGKKGFGNYWDVFLLGVVFALAFCPYSGVLYFGILIPLTISATEGALLAVVFALATGIPVILFAWLLAYTVSGVSKTYNKVKLFEKWFRKIVALLFIAVGIYYIYIIYL
ncbi:MAG: aromatic aminobenezylarsenical efflux permease ArsG family transporter [Bacteroidales bacterium]|nr:aromatic aminobenezylarsenical efflux permease ArsG family transporter [Bacteroidales bacterium]